VRDSVSYELQAQKCILRAMKMGTCGDEQVDPVQIGASHSCSCVSFRFEDIQPEIITQSGL
jgi:hypothetical protein